MTSNYNTTEEQQVEAGRDQHSTPTKITDETNDPSFRTPESGGSSLEAQPPAMPGLANAELPASRKRPHGHGGLLPEALFTDDARVMAAEARGDARVKDAEARGDARVKDAEARAEARIKAFQEFAQERIKRAEERAKMAEEWAFGLVEKAEERAEKRHKRSTLAHMATEWSVHFTASLATALLAGRLH